MKESMRKTNGRTNSEERNDALGGKRKYFDTRIRLGNRPACLARWVI